MTIARFGSFLKSFGNNVFSFLDLVQIRYYFDCLIVGIIIAIAFFIFEPSLDSQWGILDDHEIVYYSPSSHPMGFSDLIPTLLSKTEVSPSSTLPRFRPVYYFLRLVETRLWSSESPFPWYLTRIFIYILFLCIVYIFFKRFNGRLVSGVITLLVATFNFWNGIFSRLGPSETYVIIGICFFMIGILVLLKNKESNLAWFLLMIGTVLAIGSKENLIIILVPEIFLFILFFRKPIKSNAYSISMISISLIMMLWIVVTLLMRIKTNGADVYGNSIGILERFGIFGQYITDNSVLLIFLVILFIVGIIGATSKRTIYIRFLFLNLIFGTSGILLLIFSQQFFYSGSIWGRYNIPYALYLPFTLSLAANFLQNLPYNHNKFLSHLTTIGISIVIVLFIQPSNVIMLRKISNEYAFFTEQFAANLKDIEYFSSTNPDAALVFYGTKPENDFEKIISFVRFLRNDQCLNDIYIYRDTPSNFQISFSTLEASLEKQLVLWSESGKPDEGIKPISDYYENPTNCLLISMDDKHPQEIACESVIIVQ